MHTDNRSDPHNEPHSDPLNDRHAAIRATFEASQAGRLHFGQVIRQLLQAQVESYQVDDRAGRTTCYLSGDEVLDLAFAPPPQPIAQAFDAEALRAAIRGAQQGEVMYPQFKQLSQQAGCTGYTVWLTGRQVSYYGRRGETHVEHFPS